MPSRVLIAALLLAVLAALPAAASASSVEVAAGTNRLVYTADDGEDNDVSITVAVNFQDQAFIDDSVRLDPLEGCRRAGNRTQVACDIGTNALRFVKVDLGDGDDHLLYRVSQAATDPFPDLLLDGPGDDVVQADSYTGRMANGPGNDLFRCIDRCRVLTGSGFGAGRVTGGGNDRIYGGRGNDRLEGGSGNDRIYGGAGDDLIYGGRGDDRMFGGPGTDTLFGGRGSDFASPGSGRGDRLFP